ncbi:DUF4153 domain-containing protein [Alkaliphilus hydrothermalis]|uniref:DUF4153 domain-containing protein n=1 Tax=Alkaliphilus hydrothermalis TaxID=1482730 RepID=A0ABS2NLN8_9FIRM|nr:DUF4153 domain-containing protein [Alkaliphilus hydrothermalis]MBM7613806.1 hypothetical protein [Alkaliphilus hydrothermalis]
MVRKVINLVKIIIQKLLTSFKRFPLPLLMAVATVIHLMWLNHLDYGGRLNRDSITRVAMALALGVPVFLCVKMYLERSVHRTKKTIGIIYTVASLFLGINYFLFLRNELDMVNITRYFGLTLAFYIAFTYIPYLDRKANYDLYVIKLITRFFIVFIYSVVLFFGLIAIIFTVDQLFSVGLSGEIYFDIWLMVAGIFAPAFFLGEIPAYGENMNTKDYPKVFKVLVLYIIMPLLSVYTVILYSYFVKILITRQWPQGLITNLVLWYSVISTIIIFLTQPLTEENQWAKVFKQALSKAIIPLLAMMFVALFIRINEYGITESRYFVLVVGLWVTGSMLYFAIRKNQRNILLAISISLVALLSVVGPVSSYSISKYSQNMRLKSILVDNSMLQQDGIIPEKNAPQEVISEVSEIVHYFKEYHSLKDLNYVPDDFDLETMEQVFGFQFNRHQDGRYNYPQYHHYDLGDSSNLYIIKEFDYFIPLEYYSHRNKGLNFDQDNLSIEYKESKNEISISYKGEVIYTKNIEDLAVNIHQTNSNKKPSTAEELSFNDENHKVKVFFGFKRFMLVENKKTAEFGMESFDMYFFVKIKQ